MKTLDIIGYAAPVGCIDKYKNTWLLTWDEKIIDNDTHYVGITFNHKPTLQEVKDTILSWYNIKIDTNILTGFVWNDIPVWLSMENQFNYKAAYDLAIQTNGQSLPTFKFGTTETPVYHKFETLEELKDFYISAMSYVTGTLANGWQEKDKIDWTVYENLLK